MEFSRPEYWTGEPFPSPGDLPNPGIEPRSLSLQVDSSPSEPQGKPKNTGVGSLSFLQQIFPTQELNRGLLLYCRWILYQLSYQGSLKLANQYLLEALLPISISSAWNAGDPGSIPGLGRSPGEGKGYPLQYSGLEFFCLHEFEQAPGIGDGQGSLQCGRPGFDSWVGKIPWRGERLPIPVF